MQKWIDFYRPFFSTDDEARTFVDACEQLFPPDNVALIIMHQCQRLVTISDDLQKCRPEKEALWLLFLMMCAENVAKLHDGYREDGKSRAYVRKFFETFLSEQDRDTLKSGFADHQKPRLPRLGLRGAVDMLYDVRCDVVHEGTCWGFSFHDGRTAMVNTDPDVVSYLTFGEFRDIVIRGCINAVRDRLPAP